MIRTVVQDDGCPIHVETRGDPVKPALLLSNSLGTHLGMWDPQADAFADHFFLVRYDSRGHGQSGVPTGAYSIARLGRDALGVMDALALSRVHWCGLSKGGMVGQWMGVHARHRLHKLVLCNTAARMPTPAMWNDLRIRKVLREGMAPMLDTILTRWFTPAFRASGSPMLAHVAHMVRTTPAAGYAACSGAIRDMDQRFAIRSITTATLVVIGAADPATTPADGHLIADAIPGARRVVLETAHLSNIEQPQAFTAAVLGFLTEGC